MRNIEAVKAECQRYDPIYRIDCLQRGLRLTAQRIPRNEAYGDMKRAVTRAADKLDAIVRANIDTRAPRLDAKPGANPRFARNRSYRAIKRENLAKAMAAASQVVTELQTELLRAADNSRQAPATLPARRRCRAVDQGAAALVSRDRKSQRPPMQSAPAAFGVLDVSISRPGCRRSP